MGNFFESLTLVQRVPSTAQMWHARFNWRDTRNEQVGACPRRRTLMENTYVRTRRPSSIPVAPPTHPPWQAQDMRAPSPGPPWISRVGSGRGAAGPWIRTLFSSVRGSLPRTMRAAFLHLIVAALAPRSQWTWKSEAFDIQCSVFGTRYSALRIR